MLIERSEMIETQARIFDDLRSGSQRCFLIKKDGHTKRFVSVLELSSGWYVGWDRFREAFGLRVATADAGFADKLAQSPYLAYGTPDADGEIDVYEISPDKRDKVPPTETNPAWKVFVERDEKERFAVPE